MTVPLAAHGTRRSHRSSESARFERALDGYRQVVDQCDLRVP